jgi:hypothetical protein
VEFLKDGFVFFFGYADAGVGDLKFNIAVGGVRRDLSTLLRVVLSLPMDEA